MNGIGFSLYEEYLKYPSVKNNEIVYYNPLNERIYNISEDVDYIYRNSFESFIDDFQNNKIIDDIYDYNTASIEDRKEFDKNIRLYSSDILLSSIKSTDLKGLDCVKANKIMPIKIYTGIFKAGSYHAYNYWERTPFISISLNYSLYSLMLNSSVIHKSIINSLEGKLNIRASNEFTEERVKSTISHELSHWIDNATHDIFKHIVGNETTPQGKLKALKLNKNKPVNSTYYEIQGQIHSLIEYKKKYGRKWDLITWEELFNFQPSLYVIAEKLLEKNDFTILNNWFLNLYHRMEREDLVGTKMRDQLRKSTIKNILIDILNPTVDYGLVH